MQKAALKAVFLAVFLTVFQGGDGRCDGKMRRQTRNSQENRRAVGSLHGSLDGSLFRSNSTPQQTNEIRVENTLEVDAGKYVKRAGATPRFGPRCGPTLRGSLPPFVAANTRRARLLPASL